MRRFGCFLAVALAITACAPAPSRTSVEERWTRASDKSVPRKVLLLPANIRMDEIAMDGTMVGVEAWSQAVSDSAGGCIRKLLSQKIPLDLIDSPELDAEAEQAVRQHVALYDRVVQNAYLVAMSQVPAWRERGTSMDYTLGPGLTALANRTGVDAALIVSGNGYVPTAGRQTLMSALLILANSAPSRPMEYRAPIDPTHSKNCSPTGWGGAFMSIGIVDLRTGDLLWFRADLNCATNLSSERDLQGMMEGLLRTLPQGGGGKPGNVTQ